MRRNRNDGFSAIDTLLVIVLVILLGVLGWYVWHQRNLKKASISATSAPIVARKPKPPSDPTASWKTFSSTRGQYSFKYNPNYQTAICEQVTPPENLQPSPYVIIDTRAFDPTAACYSGEEPQQIVIRSDAGNHLNDLSQIGVGIPDHIAYDSQKSIIVSGVTGERDSGTMTQANDYVGTEPAGSKLILYKFYTNNRTYTFKYFQEPSWKDIATDFDLMVQKTLKFSAQ